MRRCNGRLFDGSACNNPLLDCPDCGSCGCQGDGCDSQLYTSPVCDCGTALPQLAVSAA